MPTNESLFKWFFWFIEDGMKNCSVSMKLLYRFIIVFCDGAIRFDEYFKNYVGETWVLNLPFHWINIELIWKMFFREYFSRAKLFFINLRTITCQYFFRFYKLLSKQNGKCLFCSECFSSGIKNEIGPLLSNYSHLPLPHLHENYFYSCSKTLLTQHTNIIVEESLTVRCVCRDEEDLDRNCRQGFELFRNDGV